MALMLVSLKKTETNLIAMLRQGLESADCIP